LGHFGVKDDTKMLKQAVWDHFELILVTFAIFRHFCLFCRFFFLPTFRRNF
jgi:hypothetical protein